MERFLGTYSAFFYALLRIIAGLMFAMHGSAKLFGIPGNRPVPLGSLLGVAGVIELVGGIMIALGLLTSYVAFIACGQMAVAFFKQHFPSPNGVLPIQNGGELAVVYCFLFLYIAAQGSGVWALDGLLRRSRPVAA